MDHANPLIFHDVSCVDPRIRFNGQAKSIFTDLESKEMFPNAKWESGRYYQRRILSKMSLDKRELNKYKSLFFMLK